MRLQHNSTLIVTVIFLLTDSHVTRKYARVLPRVIGTLCSRNPCITPTSAITRNLFFPESQTTVRRVSIRALYTSSLRTRDSSFTGHFLRAVWSWHFLGGNVEASIVSPRCERSQKRSILQAKFSAIKWKTKLSSSNNCRMDFHFEAAKIWDA